MRSPCGGEAFKGPELGVWGVGEEVWALLLDVILRKEAPRGACLMRWRR